MKNTTWKKIFPSYFQLVGLVIRSEMVFIDELQHIQAPVARSDRNSRRARSFLVRIVARIAESEAGGRSGGVIPIENSTQIQ